MTETKSAGSWVIGLRKKLIKSKILVKKDNLYQFESDYVFSSPSTAAAVVLARQANGWKQWKYEDGKTLDKVKRQK